MEVKTTPNLRALLERKEDRPIADDFERGDEQEYTAFAHGRIGIRPQVTIAFVKADGAVLALAYSHLYSIVTDNPSCGFTARFTETEVTVIGRNLSALFRLLCQHRVAEIRECERSTLMGLPEESPCVESITEK